VGFDPDFQDLVYQQDDQNNDQRLFQDIPKRSKFLSIGLLHVFRFDA